MDNGGLSEALRESSSVYDETGAFRVSIDREPTVFEPRGSFGEALADDEAFLGARMVDA